MATASIAVVLVLIAIWPSSPRYQDAILVLGMIGRQPEKCIPVLVPFLTSPSISDRQKAMAALIGFGTNEGALKDSDPWVRNRAQAALKILEENERVKR